MSSRKKNRKRAQKVLGDTCWICKTRILTLGQYTKDHVIPKSLGGSLAWHNLEPAHKSCNRARKNGPPPVHKGDYRARQYRKALRTMQQARRAEYEANAVGASSMLPEAAGNA